MQASLRSRRQSVEVPQTGLSVGDGTPRSCRSKAIWRIERPRPCVGAEDLAHHLGLGLVDLDARGPARLGRQAAVAVGHLPEEDLALAGAVKLAAPVALGDLRPFVFGDHPLHLHQQRGLRVVRGRGHSRKRTSTPKCSSSSRISTW
jgi:hypothetical protein